jgi:hypothetical protein
LDRFSREYATGMIELLQLSRAGFHLADTRNGLLDQNDTAGQLRAFLGFLTSSDWLKKHGRRVRLGIRQRVAEGYFFGKPPYGYRRLKTPGGPTLEPDPVEAPILAGIFAQAAAGTSAHGIALGLGAAGVLTRAGLARWDTSTVRAILSNPTYLGQIIQYAPGVQEGKRLNRFATPPGQVITFPGQHPALVDYEVFQAVSAQYFKGGQGNRQRPRKYALSGLLVCGACGRSAVVARQQPRSYRCHPYGESYPCPSVRLVRQEALERAVREWALQLANDPRAVDLAAREAVLMEWEQAQRGLAARAPIEREIAGIEAQIAAAFSLVEAGNAPALVNRRLAALETDLAGAQRALEAVGQVVEPLPVSVARGLFLGHLREGAINLQKLRGLIEKIIMPADIAAPVVLVAAGRQYSLGTLAPAKGGHETNGT